jgi:multidrug efflux pump subunit AcrA (membrane-fusion protein)
MKESAIDNNMKTMMVKVSALLCWAFLVLACQSDKREAGSADHYTCPMHPTVLSATQGACPVCGMDLVRKARAGEEVVITEALAKRLQSPDESVIASARTTRPVFSRQPLVVNVQGVVAYDTRFVHSIPARVGGRLEKVYLRYPYQPVRKGQPVAEMYSPEMLTAQRELLFLLKTDSTNEFLIRAAKQKLTLLGATTSQIESWSKTGEANPRFTVFSPVDGYVILPDSPMPSVPRAAPSGSAAMGGDMNAPPATPTAATEPAQGPGMVRMGDYVSRGQLLFTIASRESMRIEFSVPVHLVGALHVGDHITIEVNGGVNRKGTVDFVQPFYEEGDVFQKIRTYVKEPSLRIGQLVNARLEATSPETLWIPRKAVTDLGSAQVVFVKDRGVFKAREIETGIRTNGWLEVRSGLASSEEIAEEAGFLVDSESFIKTNRTK